MNTTTQKDSAYYIRLHNCGKHLNDMRDWINDCQWDDLEDAYDLSDLEVLKGIERNFSGGIAEFMTTCIN